MVQPLMCMSCVTKTMSQPFDQQARRSCSLHRRNVMHKLFFVMQHGINFLWIVGEMFLNSIPFYPYLLGYVGLWTSFYGIWAFINFSSSGKWMYPVSLHPAKCSLLKCFQAVCSCTINCLRREALCIGCFIYIQPAVDITSQPTQYLCAAVLGCK